MANDERLAPRDSYGPKWSSRRISAVLLLATLCLTPLIWHGGARAAVQLNYFVVQTFSDFLVLQWSTASEYNVAAFIVLCKEIDQPDSEYHPIGRVAALGTAQTGATYDFVPEELKSGVGYCFRVQEETTDQMPGDAFDRCGYGIGFTPTAVGAVPTVGSSAAFPQPIVIPAQASPPAAVQPPGLEIVATSDALDLFDATPTPQTLAPVATATPPGLETLFVTALPTPQMLIATATPPGPLSPLGLNDPALAATATALISAAAVQPDSALLLPSPLPQDTEGIGSLPPQDALPETPYVVWTATPTLAPVALVATFTPLPSNTPAPTAVPFALTDLAWSSNPNLLMALLCFTVIGASGLGVLGLTGLGLYLRSRGEHSRPPSRRRLDF